MYLEGTGSSFRVDRPHFKSVGATEVNFQFGATDRGVMQFWRGITLRHRNAQNIRRCCRSFPSFLCKMGRKTQQKKAKNAKQAAAKANLVFDTCLKQKWILDGAKEGMERVLTDHNLTKSSSSSPVFQTTRRGTDASESGQRKRYETLWERMCKFFCLIGDYQSALLCSRGICPDRPLPMKPESVCFFLSYLTDSPGDRIKHYKTGELLCYRKGNPLLALGAWNEPNNVNILQAAIRALHGMYTCLRGT